MLSSKVVCEGTVLYRRGGGKEREGRGGREGIAGDKHVSQGREGGKYTLPSLWTY